jgi:hypothetical protein
LINNKTIFSFSFCNKKVEPVVRLVLSILYMFSKFIWYSSIKIEYVPQFSRKCSLSSTGCPTHVYKRAHSWNFLFSFSIAGEWLVHLIFDIAFLFFVRQTQMFWLSKIGVRSLEMLSFYSLFFCFAAKIITADTAFSS